MDASDEKSGFQAHCRAADEPVAAIFQRRPSMDVPASAKVSSKETFGFPPHPVPFSLKMSRCIAQANDTGLPAAYPPVILSRVFRGRSAGVSHRRKPASFNNVMVEHGPVRRH